MPAGLAYSGRIEKLEPIPNADRIELATSVCGEGGKWQGVVKKGDFVVGQPCTTILQDAIVPATLGLGFLASSNYRVKMARFRGAPSECVIIPSVDCASPIGIDLTEALGLTKYVKELSPSLQGVARGNFPAFIPKTDEPNFQAAYRLTEALQGKPWVATVKYDGSSVTYYRKGERFGVCSRNLELVESDCTAWRMARKYGIMNSLCSGEAIQCELIGPGIQGNPCGLSEHELRMFNVWDIEKQKYRDHIAMHRFSSCIGVPEVEVACSGNNFSFDEESRDLRRLAEGVYQGTTKQREGIVIRPRLNEEWVGQSRLSFKVINLLYKD